MKRNNLFKFVITALPVLCVPILSGCNNNSSSQKIDHDLRLSETEITLIEGGQTHQLIVYDKTEPYLGQISWSSSYSIYATVYQGIVKGIRAGNTVVSAKIGSTVLSCNVTVNKNLTANIESLMVFAGSGDIDLSLSPVELVPGSSYTASAFKDESGETIPNKIYKNNDIYYLRNDISNKLDSGKYFVEYDISNDGLTAKGMKPVIIKPTDEYKDLFIIDPLDGSETIKGYTACQSSYLGDIYENPGEYVKYNERGNTGFTEDNNLYQNREEFLDSLIQSGYTGYFTNSTTRGYDTTYRYYCRKDVYTTSPRPFFYLDMPESSNPMWDYLDQFPSNASIDIWVRCYFRAYGDEDYAINQTNYMYVFKGMNNGNTYFESCSSFAASNDKEHGWSKYSISIGNATAYLSGAKHLALCWETNSTAPGEFYFEVYSVELSGMSFEYAPNKTIKNFLVGSYTNLFDNYTISAYNKKTGAQLVKNTDYFVTENNISFNVSSGVYVVKYQATNGQANVFAFDKLVYVGIVTNLNTKSDISKSGWLPTTEAGYFASSPVGLPSEAFVDNDGVCYNKTQNVAGRAIPVFPVGSVLSDINNISDSKRLVIYSYFTHPIINTLNFYLSVGGPHLGGASPTNNGKTIYYNGTWGGHPISNQPTQVNQWTTIEIPISTIRDFMNTRPDLAPDTLSIELRYGDGKIDYAYFYAIVLK